MPSACKRCTTSAKQLPPSLKLVRRCDHRKHNPEVSTHGSARQRAELNGKDLGPGQAKPQAPNPEERIGFAVQREARHRLVAARVKRANGDRTPVGPTQHRIVSLKLRLLVGQAAPLRQQKLGAHQADAIGILRVGVLEIVDSLDIDEQLDPLATPRCRGPPQDRTGGRPALAMAFAPLLEQADLLGAGIKFERRAFAVEQRGGSDARNHAELHDHGDAPRARQHRDVAGGTATQKHQTATAGPVDLQESRRRQIVGTHDGAARNLQRLALASPQNVDHAVAEVHKVRGARLQIFVRRRIVIRDLRVEGRTPSDVSRIPISDRRENRLDEILVLQERDLEFENLRGLAAGDPGQIRDLPACRVNRSTSKRFGRVEAVRELSLAVNDGEFLVLLGPSGAGKTTTLRLITGLESPDAGSVMINGRDVTHDPPGSRDITHHH